MTLFPSHAQLTALHRCVIAGPNWACLCGADWECGHQWHDQHQDAEWAKACTINTVERLNHPHLSGWGTLIKEIHHPGDGCDDHLCWIVPVVWEMVNQVGWVKHGGSSFGGDPHLPAQLIDHPDWVRAQQPEAVQP